MGTLQTQVVDRAVDDGRFRWTSDLGKRGQQAGEVLKIANSAQRSRSGMTRRWFSLPFTTTHQKPAVEHFPPLPFDRIVTGSLFGSVDSLAALGFRGGLAGWRSLSRQVVAFSLDGRCRLQSKGRSDHLGNLVLSWDTDCAGHSLERVMGYPWQTRTLMTRRSGFACKWCCESGLRRVLLVR